MALSKAEIIEKLLPEVKLNVGGEFCNKYCGLCKHVVGPLGGSVLIALIVRDCQGVDGEGVCDTSTNCVVADVLRHYGAT